MRVGGDRGSSAAKCWRCQRASVPGRHIHIIYVSIYRSTPVLRAAPSLQNINIRKLIYRLAPVSCIPAQGLDSHPEQGFNTLGISQSSSTQPAQQQLQMGTAGAWTGQLGNKPKSNPFTVKSSIPEKIFCMQRKHP